MSIYDDMQKIAQDLLGPANFKQGETYLIKLLPGGGPAYAPGKPVEKLHSIDAAVRGAKYKYIAKQLAVASDLQVTFAPIAVEPEARDFVQLDGVRYKIVHIDRKPSAGVAVAFTLIVRR